MKRLPIPQHEFGFVAQTFCLFQDNSTDGDRLAHIREEAEAARAASEAAQRGLFPKARASKNRSSLKAKRA